MKRTISMTALLAVVLVGPMFAQESSRVDFQEFCRAWQGRWVGEVTRVADWPSQGKKGDKVTAYVEMKFVEDSNALMGRFFGGDGSATFPSRSSGFGSIRAEVRSKL